jgi:mono/diheme cytochrome c family protein
MQTEPAHTPVPRAHPVTQEIRDTYQFYCTQCHGTDGHGKGINAPQLTVPPRDHTKADYLETRTDEQLFTAIQQGGLAVGRAPCMPSWQHTLDENTIHSLVSYIRELCQCESL